MVLGPTQSTGWAPPAGLTNTSSNSNLVFPGGLPSGTDQAQCCLASVDNLGMEGNMVVADTEMTHSVVVQSEMDILVWNWINIYIYIYAFTKNICTLSV